VIPSSNLIIIPTPFSEMTPGFKPIPKTASAPILAMI